MCAIIAQNKLLEKALADFTFVRSVRVALHQFVKKFISPKFREVLGALIIVFLNSFLMSEK